MNLEFDVIIVGSGPAGVSAAFPLVQSGLRILMVDGGKRPTIKAPRLDFLSARYSDVSQWKWMIGENFHALKMRDAVSPKLRVPTHAYTFDDFEYENKIRGNDFITVGSLATGGLSNSWGCGVAHYSDDEISKFPFPAKDIEVAYKNVSKRIGISGAVNDDLSDYFGLDEVSQPAISMDVLHTYLGDRYKLKRKKLNSHGFKLGRSRVAVLSENVGDRKGCNLSGNCLFGCDGRALYSASDELLQLRQYENFTELSGFIVDSVKSHDGYWSINGKSVADKKYNEISAKKIILAAGTLATTRIVLQALSYKDSVPVLSSPTAAFLLWIPKLLGTPRAPGFGLGQLSYTLSLSKNVTAFGSTFSTTGIPLSEFVRHVPFRRRYGIDFLKELLTSCVVGNLFLPGDLTKASAQMKSDGTLNFSGEIDEEVQVLMRNSRKKLRKIYKNLGAVLLPSSFTIGRPGGDIHYAGTLPMHNSPAIGKTSALGEVVGLDGLYAVDGSCLPVLSEKSHTLTIMANADRIGRKLSSILK